MHDAAPEPYTLPCSQGDPGGGKNREAPSRVWRVVGFFVLNTTLFTKGSSRTGGSEGARKYPRRSTPSQPHHGCSVEEGGICRVFPEGASRQPLAARGRELCRSAPLQRPVQVQSPPHFRVQRFVQCNSSPHFGGGKNRSFFLREGRVLMPRLCPRARLSRARCTPGLGGAPPQPHLWVGGSHRFFSTVGAHARPTLRHGGVDTSPQPP